MSKEINLDNLQKYREDFNSFNLNQLLTNAVNKNGVLATAFNTAEANKLPFVFNVEVSDSLAVTHQKQSGRCWMFSSLNMLRPSCAKKLEVKDFEFSESYLFFYDKLEKCNLKLQLIIDNIDAKDDDRVLEKIQRVGGDFDGGYWHYFKELVKKYGLVPKAVMNETYSSSSSREMDSVLAMLLGKDFATLRNAYKEGADIKHLMALKEVMLNEVYRVLGICLGLPVEEFTYEYRKDNETKDYVCIHTTPKQFAQDYCDFNLDDIVVIVNHPSPDYPFYTKYMNEFAINMAEQEYFVYNLPLAEFKEAIIQMLKDNRPVGFTCDVSRYAIRQEGILSRKVINIDELFGIDFNYQKFDRVKYGDAFWNHAMTLMGVNIDENNKPNRWKIQNSWGVEVGNGGNFICDDDWFDEYVYQAFVDKKYLSKEALKHLEDNTQKLKYFDPIQ